MVYVWRGGQNIKCFTPEVAACYSSLNTDSVHAQGLHDSEQVLWEPACIGVGCGCLLYKSRHTVQASILRIKKKRVALRLKVPTIPPALECPLHTPNKASGPAKRAYAVLRVVVRQLRQLLGPTIIVWEAQVVAGARWFDFWLRGWGVLVEVDGSQHSSDLMYRKDIRQEKRDRAKEALALAAGRTVVRLDEADEELWPQLLKAALQHGASTSPCVPRIYYSPFNVPKKPPCKGHKLDSASVSGFSGLDELEFTTPIAKVAK
eukprot:XP_001689777.1 predicted protein [Chlamydomonas reinhardtii]